MHIVPDAKSLVAELQPLKSRILNLAKSSAAAASILQELSDNNCSEGSDFFTCDGWSYVLPVHISEGGNRLCPYVHPSVCSHYLQN